MMIRKGTCVIAALVVVLAAGCGSGSKSGSGPVTVKLTEQGSSGESGTATLTSVGDQTKVVLDLTGTSGMEAPEPAHIHKGSCSKLDPTPAYALNDVKGGTSTSTVAVKLADLRNGSFAINVHKSAAAIQVYVACGDIGTGKSSGGGSGGYGY
jgi:hypothetical protein